MTLPARPMPKPTAQVAPYVECLGPDLAVRFLVAFGGAELYLATDPKGHGKAEALVGAEGLARMADHYRIGSRAHVPLARAWPAAMLHWQGQSTAEVARTIRASEVSVRRWLKEAGA